MVWLSTRGATVWGDSPRLWRAMVWSMLVAIVLGCASMLQTLASTGLIAEESAARSTVCGPPNFSTAALVQDGDDTRARFLVSYCRGMADAQAP